FFHDSIDVDPDPNTKYMLISMGDIDLFVLKLDANGDFMWATRFGGIDEDYGDELVLIDDKIFVSGRFELSFNVKVNSTSQTYQSKGYKDAFLMCMNTSGNVLWNRTFGGTASDYARGLAADSLKNVYLTGSYRFTVDFAPGPSVKNKTSAGYQDVFILSLDSLGNFRWVNVNYCPGTNHPAAITIDKNQDLIVSSDFNGIIDVNPDSAITQNITTHGNHDILLQKFNSNGTLLWYKHIGGNKFDRIYALATDTAGNIYGTGAFGDTVDFDPGTGVANRISQGYFDGFLFRYSPQADFVWVRTFPAVEFVTPAHIRVTENNEIFSSGRHNKGMTVNVGGSNQIFATGGNYDGYLLKHDINGTGLFASTLGNYREDAILSFAINNNDELVTTGFFGNIVDFDLGPSTHSITAPGIGKQLFIAKYSQCPYTKIDVIESCEPIVWRNGNLYSSSNSSATFTVNNPTGCDSVYQLDFTRKTVKTQVINLGSALTVNEYWAYYQWIDCATMTPIAGATQQNFIPAQAGSYAVIVTKDGCTDTSSCTLFSGLDLKENFEQNISIYPNPTKGDIHIELDNNLSINSIEIFNTSGQSLKRIQVENQPELDVNIKGKSGIYILRIIGDQKMYYWKVIKL
ncbi:MAG: T9SS type A sorting domain-containing protein, partial [Schleiferiaceae bacterium]|nr:T9SS type A sorting domain-containing protein [Schleiferiaceae bacterium]